MRTSSPSTLPASTHKCCRFNALRIVPRSKALGAAGRQRSPLLEYTCLSKDIACLQPHYQQHQRWTCRCSAKPSPEAETAQEPLFNPRSVGLLVLWAVFAGYSFGLSPNQVPDSDIQAIKQLSGLVAEQDATALNPIFSQIMFALGAWPWTFAALLLPSGRSGKNVPAWPFILASFLFAFYALAPYFSVWTPSAASDVTALPPDDEEKSSAKNFRKLLESPLSAIALFGSVTLFVTRAATAGPEAWAAFPELFGESRVVHASTLDFTALTLAAPFWVLNDAARRGWKERRSFPIAVLACIPVLGPQLYLVLRPRPQ